MDRSLEIKLESNGIIVLARDASEIIGWSPKLKVGDRWLVGAVDKAMFPYEVMIVVVNRVVEDAR